jgi:hemerythrin-like domain-containing protein
VPRRAVLLGAGALAAAGAGAGLAVGAGGLSGQEGSATPSASEASAAQLRTDEAQPAPAEDLMNEHGLLVRVLLIYRYLAAQFQAHGQFPARPLYDAALIIHDYIEGFHEPLEEGYVFPRLRQAGQLTSTVSTLLLQHARGREQTQLILARAATVQGDAAASGGTGRALAGAMTMFVRMYAPHEAREDTVIYPAFRKLLPAAEIVELGQRFASLQQEQFGANGFATMVGKVASIEQTLGLYDLTQFTPPEITPPPLPASVTGNPAG